MLSTLFLLVLTAVLLQSVIKISANYIVQLNQISSSYQARAALNMSERILNDYIVDNNNELPEEAEISSSVGKIKIVKRTKNTYDAVITQENGLQFTKKINIDSYETDEEQTEENIEESTDSPEKDSLAPEQEEKISSD